MRPILKSLGLSEKEIDVYLACVRSGPQPVRKIAQEAQVNRGTTYDILKSLVSQGLVSYYHKKRHQYFIAEDPSKLREVVAFRAHELESTKKQIEEIIPQLRSIYNNAEEKPVARYYEGFIGVRGILQDVISTCTASPQKQYAAYSAEDIRPHIYKEYPNFTKDRIKAGIRVRVIALGKGGETHGLDERKWLPAEEPAPTYQIIYPHKLALITADESKNLLGVIIEDAHLAQTQQVLFNALWDRL